MADSRKRADSLTEPLSEREQEVLRLVADGASNREIAQQLVIGMNTVKKHINHIFGKLGVASREEAIEQAAALGLLRATDAGAALPEVQHNLPVQTTTFIGRQRELTELTRLIADPNTRLLTILAPGGMGKTRLSLAAAEKQLWRFADGVFFVPLAPLTSPDDIVSAIAEHVGFSFYGDDPPQQQLTSYFRKREVLLVLDNFEHLLDGAPLVTDFLQAAPAVKVLVTSRERLNLRGETVLTLSGMYFPDWETPEDALEYDAVRLFMQSAYQARPDFELQVDDLKYLARICRLVAGMPLGIVLAAGWLDVLSLARIAAEIQQDIDILETEQRDVPERQRSVRATFNYSWGRLTDTEQDVFRKLSVFRGGFTSEAAEAVAGADARALRRLSSKSLVRVLPTGRYDIHELLRQYAEEYLNQSTEAESVHDAYIQYFAETLYEYEAQLKDHRVLEAVTEIQSDFENARAAWRLALKRVQYEAIDRMAYTLEKFAKLRQRNPEGEALFGAVVQQLTDIPDTGHQRLLAKVQACYAHFLVDLDQPAQAETMLRDSLAALREQGEASDVIYCLWFFIRSKVALPKYAEAFQLAQELLAVSSEASDTWGMGWAYWFSWLTCSKLGRSAEAHTYAQQALARFTEIRHPRGKAWAQLAVSSAAGASMSLDDRHRFVLQSYYLFKELGDKWGMGDALNNLGTTAFMQGNWDLSEQYFREALSVWRDVSFPPKIANTLSNKARLALVNEDFAQAEQLARESISIFKATNHRGEIAEPIFVLSEIAAIKEANDAACSLAQEGLVYARGGTPRLMLEARFHLGWALCCHGAYDESIAHLCTALQQFVDLWDTAELLQSIAAFALIVAHRQQYERAVALLGLVFRHPTQAQVLIRHPKLTTLRQELETKLDSDVYTAAWEHISPHGVHQVARDLMTEFAAEQT